MSSPSRPLALKHLINRPSASYAALLQQVQECGRLQQIFTQLLPNTWRDHIQIAKLSTQTLLIYTSSPAWTSKLRYQLPDLTEKFKMAAHWPELSDIHIRTLPTAGPQVQKASQKRPQLSPETALLLKQTSQSIADSGLSRALLRLARHGGS